MHPHGVKYNPEYDGAYMGEFTRAGGFVAPGETFTYQWECVPDSVGAWPYHDHGPNHTLNTFRGLFGAIIVRPRGAKRPDRIYTLFAHQLAAAGHRPGAQLPLLQRPRLRGQHADAARARRRGRRDQRVRHGLQLPHVPHPRPPLEGPGGGLHRQPGVRARTSASRPASSRTTRAAGSTTATSSPTRTRAWRAGTWSTLGERRGHCASSLLVCRCASRCSRPPRASAQTYPEPKEPGPGRGHAEGPAQDATRSARQGVRLHDDPEGGRQGEGRRHDPRQATAPTARPCKINGSKKRYLKLIGNPTNPAKVLLLAGATCRTAISVNDADEVTVDGFMARGYKANGFFFTNLNGYTMNHLIARQTGVYGLYAFNTIGGKILNSEAYYVNDGAFYIGQTPPQTKPIRTIVRNVDGWGSPLGFSATNMRYVTITKSRFYNNALGIAPERPRRREVPAGRGQRDHRQRHLLEQLQLPPGQPAVRGAHDRRRRARAGRHRHPPARRPRQPDREQPHLRQLPRRRRGGRGHPGGKTPEARALANNVVQNNQFGLNGTDVNGYDIIYDGNGTNNCFSMAGVTSTFPADGSTFAGCGGANAFSKAVAGRDARLDRRERAEGLEQAPAPGQAGYTPLEVFGVMRALVIGAALLVGAAPAQAAAPRRRRRRRRQLLRAQDRDGEPRDDGHVELARLRGGR